MHGLALARQPDSRRVISAALQLRGEVEMQDLSFVRCVTHPEWGIGSIRQTLRHRETGELGYRVYFPSADGLENPALAVVPRTELAVVPRAEVTVIPRGTDELILNFHAAHVARLGYESKKLIPPKIDPNYPYTSGCRRCKSTVDKATNYRCPHCSALICSTCASCFCPSLPS